MNIYIVKNIIDVDLCNEFINLIDALPLQKRTYAKYNNVMCYVTTLTDCLQASDELYYVFPSSVSEHNDILSNLKQKKILYGTPLNGIRRSEVVKYNDIMTEKMGVLSDIMMELKISEMKFDNTGYILRRIYGPTRLHSDGITEIYNSNVNFIKGKRVDQYRMIRNASVVFALNDNYEGGIFEFPYQNISVKLDRGSVIIFPPFWTHPHKTTELLNGTVRYTINTWTCQQV
jgi:hypothetical protein